MRKLIIGIICISCSDELSHPPLIDGDPYINIYGTMYGPCNIEGTTRRCIHNINEKDCYLGLQTCNGDIWGRCEEVSLFKVQNTQSCINNPCNPNCIQIEETPEDPITPDPYIGDQFTTTIDGWGVTPGGFQSKLDCSDGRDCRNGYGAKCGGEKHYTKYDGCQADHNCNNTTGNCDRNGPFWTWGNSICNTIDLTIGSACGIDLGTGYSYGFPICNRGNQSIPSGSIIDVQIIHGSWINVSKCAPTPALASEPCNITLMEELKPGDCVRVEESQCPTWDSGNTVGYVNYSLNITECGMASTSPVMPEPPIGVSSPGCINNWADLKKGADCIPPPILRDPLIVVEEFIANCPAGYAPRWNLMTYSSDVPCSPGICNGTNGSNISIGVRTRSVDGVYSHSNYIEAANIPVSEPANCTMTGPDPCPINLYDILGNEPASDNSTLEVQFILSPSPDMQIGPVITNWLVTHDCYANE